MLNWLIEYAGGSLNVHGMIMRDTYSVFLTRLKTNHLNFNKFRLKLLNNNLNSNNLLQVVIYYIN
ncbi:hypothetical protein E2P39_24755 [Escherichia coli]|nr:hypothetical protein [Escherichia coli]